MAQLVYRKDYKLGYQIRVSIVFYQKQSHSEILFWLKEQINYGYVRDRNDGMTEYTIVGMEEVANVLQLLQPKLRLKKQLATNVLKLIAKHPNKMTAVKLVEMSKLVDNTAKFNYSKKRTNTSEVVVEFLKNNNLFPVETETTVAGSRDRILNQRPIIC
jgi:hypothetical protein